MQILNYFCALLGPQRLFASNLVVGVNQLEGFDLMLCPTSKLGFSELAVLALATVFSASTVASAQCHLLLTPIM